MTKRIHTLVIGYRFWDSMIGMTRGLRPVYDHDEMLADDRAILAMTGCLDSDFEY